MKGLASDTSEDGDVYTPLPDGAKRKTRHKGRILSKNDEYKRYQRRKEVARCYVQGWSQWDIAHHLDCDQKTVSNDLAWVRKEWLKESLQSFDAAKAKELAKIDHLEAVAWEAWETSKAKGVVTHKKTEKAIRMATRPKQRAHVDILAGFEERNELVPVKVVDEKTVTERVGNPAFLSQVQWCIETRVKILGLIKEADNIQNVYINWESMYERSNEQESDPVESRIILEESSVEIDGVVDDGSSRPNGEVVDTNPTESGFSDREKLPTMEFDSKANTDHNGHSPDMLPIDDGDN